MSSASIYLLSKFNKMWSAGLGIVTLSVNHPASNSLSRVSQSKPPFAELLDAVVLRIVTPPCEMRVNAPEPHMQRSPTPSLLGQHTRLQCAWSPVHTWPTLIDKNVPVCGDPEIIIVQYRHCKFFYFFPLWMDSYHFKKRKMHLLQITLFYSSHARLYLVNLVISDSGRKH